MRDCSRARPRSNIGGRQDGYVSRATGRGSGGRRGSRRGGGRRAPVSEINVTPLVDVMLVLLIIFMVAAPLMTTGVPIDLPETQAKEMNSDTKPITVSIAKDGQIYFGDETEVAVPIDEVVRSCRPWLRQARKNAFSCAATPARNMGRSWP